MPRIVDHAARRRELLEAAFHVFDADGYGAVSMRGLARGIGCSTGSLYHYFDGKEQLFEALVRQRFEADLQAFLAELPDEGGVQARQLALVGWVSSHTTHLQATLRLVLDYLRQPGSDAGFVQDVLGGYRDAVSRAVGEELAGPALSLLLGLLVHRILDEGAVDEAAHFAILGALTSGQRPD